MSANHAVPQGASLLSSDAADADVWFSDLFAHQFAAATRLAGLMGADDPENVAQEAFARVHLRRHRLGGPDEALRYLRAVVCNLSRSRLRHLKVAKNTMPRLLHTATTDSHDAVGGVDEADRIAKALRRLPQRQREVIVLRYWLGLSETEIAQTLEVTPGSVKTHTHRAMRALEAHLEDR